MKTDELIKAARKCNSYGRSCLGEDDCPFYLYDNCSVELANALADKLEMTISDINKSCMTCKHGRETLDNSPCYGCLTAGYRKNWQWRGDAE